MIVSTLLLAVAIGAAAPDDNVCVPAEDGRSWLCGTRADPPVSTGTLPAVEPPSLPPRDDPQLEVFAIPDPATTRTRAIPGSPLLQDAANAAAPQQQGPVDSQPARPPVTVPFAGDGKFTLLLASLTTIPDLLAFAEDFEVDLARAARVPILVNGNVRHVLVFGRFPSAEAARQAIPNLPYVLQSMRPTAVSLDRYANDPVPLVAPSEEVAAIAPPQEPISSVPMSADGSPAQEPPSDAMDRATDAETDLAVTASPAEDLPANSSSPREVAAPALAADAEKARVAAEMEPEPGPEPETVAEPAPIALLGLEEDPVPRATAETETSEPSTDSPMAVDEAEPDTSDSATARVSNPLAASNPFALPQPDDAARAPPPRERESTTTRQARLEPEPALEAAASGADTRPEGASWLSAQDFASAAGGYTVQMAVRSSIDTATTLAARLDLDPSRTYFVPYRGNVLVLVGRYATITDAKRALDQLPTLDNPPWVRRAKPLTRQ